MTAGLSGGGLWLPVLAALALSACVDGPCRQLRHPELAAAQQPKAPQQPFESPDEPKGAPSVVEKKPAESPNVNSTKKKDPTILVYKADGSLQCGKGKGTSVQEMEKQLDGIKVFSRDNRSDGLMRIQVCGHPTGMINVYEIPASQLKEAEKRGFKKFESRS